MSILRDLKHAVYLANQELVHFNLVIFSWGNVSGIDRDSGHIVIKPSGLTYNEMKPDDMVVVDLEGNVVSGRLRPSTDTPTHIELYRNFKNIGGVVHTHSEWASAFAQAGRPIPVFGTTHADVFSGEIPCTRSLTRKEVESGYEMSTGRLIVEKFKGFDPDAVPSVLVKGHGPFSWGKTPSMAVHNAVVLEYVAKMAFRNIILGQSKPIEKFLIEKHFLRKHGNDAYYGQK